MKTRTAPSFREWQLTHAEYHGHTDRYRRLDARWTLLDFLVVSRMAKTWVVNITVEMKKFTAAFERAAKSMKKFAAAFNKT